MYQASMKVNLNMHFIISLIAQDTIWENFHLIVNKVLTIRWYSRKDFQAYTGMQPQDFKERIIKDFDFIQKYMIASIFNDKEIEHRMNAKRLQQQGETGNAQSSENQSNTSRNESSRSRNECNHKGTSGDDTNIRPSYDTEPMAKVPYTAKYNVFAVESQHSEQPESINDTHVMEKDDSNVIPDSSNMCDNDNQADQNAQACDDERVALANLISNLKLDIDENKKIQKQLKKANTSLTQELKKCKSTLEVTNRTLGESNSTRDSCLIALQNKEIELEKYKTYLNRTTEYDTLEHKLKETQAVLAQKEHDIKEGLKLKAYEISVVNKKNDELVKQSLLTKSSYEGLIKEKNKAWEKHTYDQFRAPTAHDMEILIKTCLMPLSLKTQNDSFKFVHELKQEMYADFKYVESLEKDIDELKSDKANFSNMYDLLLQECVSQDVINSFKQTKNVGKQEYNELLRSFTKLENHLISLKLALQQCQEQMKNDTVYKQNGSTVFLKEREQYFEIQDLKAQLQDKNIAISELKKLIEKMKGKSVDTNFEKQSILGKPPLQPIRNQPVKKDAHSHKTTKRYIPVEKKSDSKKHDRQIPIGQKFSPKKSSAVYLKITPPRSSLTWKPMGRIFTQNGLLVVSGSGPAVTSNWAVCFTLNPHVLLSISPEGVKVSGGTRTRDLP
ncbi:hypothetical protein Tco_0850156 [Tanacetum coccineum]